MKIIALLLIIPTLTYAEAISFPNSPVSGVSESVDKDLVYTYENESKSARAIRKKNSSTLSRLKKIKPTQTLSLQQASILRKFLVEHPVAGDLGAKKYDAKNSMVGFCFGRATLAHMELLRRGVDPKNIRKIFIIGEMKYGSRIWELHVATVVPKADGGWWVLDGLFDQVYEVRDWYKKILSIAINKKQPKVRIYLADPVKFLPITGAYAEADMNRKEYNGFFKDLSEWLGGNPVKPEDRFF